MTVVKSRRGESELEVITKSRELAKYTIQICDNEKNFPKRHRWFTNNRIADVALDVCGFIYEANSTYVKFWSDYVIRRNNQIQALNSIERLLLNMTIAYELYHVESKRIDYWTGLVIEVQKLLRAWRDSDLKRYSNLMPK